MMESDRGYFVCNVCIERGIACVWRWVVECVFIRVFATFLLALCMRVLQKRDPA